MKKINSGLLALLLLVPGCAVARRHPRTTGIVVGSAAAVIVTAVRHHSCARSYDGIPYQGTPPCPTWCGQDGCYWGRGK